MNKLTKRKGFNFFRSYFDVYNELEKIEDKVAFIDALLERQFMGVKPTNLTGMAKFAYISQTNSIDSQVKGYEDKTGNILTPTVGGTVGGTATPCLQVEVKEKVKDINLSVNWVGLLEQFNLITNKKLKVIDEKTKRQVIARLKDGYTKADLVLAITNCFNDDYHKENPKYLTLEFITRPDKMQKYCQEFKNTKPTKKIDKL